MCGKCCSFYMSFFLQLLRLQVQSVTAPHVHSFRTKTFIFFSLPSHKINCKIITIEWKKKETLSVDCFIYKPRVRVQWRTLAIARALAFNQPFFRAIFFSFDFIWKIKQKLYWNCARNICTNAECGKTQVAQAFQNSAIWNRYQFLMLP